MASVSRYRSAQETSVWAVGFTLFAAIMMIMAGIFQILAGLIAIFENEFYVATRNYLFQFDATTWGWIHLLVGVVVAFAGWGLLSGRTWARVVAITLAVLSATANFLFIPYYPFWSLLIIALDVLVIFSVTVEEGALARLSQPTYPQQHPEEVERRQARLRFIRAQVHNPAREGRSAFRRGFQVGATHHVAVSIGPKDAAWLAGNQPFPVEKLPRAVSGHQLTVVVTEPNLLRRALVDTVTLPPFGPSDNAVFSLPVKGNVSSVEARICVLHRGRILQTALLRGEVFGAEELEQLEAANDGPAIQVLIEAVLRPDMAGLNDRTRFQAAVVLDNDREGRSLVEFIREEKAAIVSLDDVGEAVQAISKTLERAERDDAFKRELESKESVAYLSELAESGTILYQRIGQEIESRLADQPLKRIQVLSANPNTFLPVEVIYDLPPPGQNPRLCPNWEKALRDGRCNPAAFHKMDEEDHLDVVCPIGFWGVSKVIERQAVNPSSLAADPDTRGIQFAVISAPDRQRSTLGGLTPVLFAASDHINDVDSEELKRVTSALRALSGQQLDHVHSWKHWARRVKTKEPPLLLLLAHTELNPLEGAALEIAKGRPCGRPPAAAVLGRQPHLPQPGAPSPQGPRPSA